MKVKKYVAPTMPEVMQKVRKELGKDAVILNSKEIQTGGFLGFFKKKNIEVVAAHDPQPVPKNKTARKPSAQKEKAAIQETPGANQNDVLKELKSLKKVIASQSRQEEAAFSPFHQVAYERLISQEVMEQFAKQIITNVQEKTQDETDLDILMHHVKDEVTEQLQEAGTFDSSLSQRVVQFVGPTGVGKTTTIAKVAARLMLEDKKKVALITADTYRIGAVEQLRTYARILDVPVEVAYSLEDYEQAVEKFADYDHILVDTAGRNYRDPQYIKELKSLLNTDEMQTFLVVSLTTKTKDILEIYDQFTHIRVDQVIFTKLDETTQYGNLLNIVAEKQIGIAFIANGQDVPEDVETVTAERIAGLIVGESDAT